MDLFKPSTKILEIICKEKEKPLVSYEIFPVDFYEEMVNMSILYIESLYKKLSSFYNIKFENNKSRLNCQGVSFVALECFNNWIEHSLGNSNLFTGLFLGDKGVCYGFNDGGDFFKNPNIKYKIENRILFREFDKNPKGDCFNIGFNLYIYPYSDFIEVDLEKGILYCVQLKENIIAPNGQNGNEYFYNLKKKK